VEDIEEIQDLIDKINTQDSKEYQEMKIEELSTEIRNVIKFQQESFQKIEEFEIKGMQQDLIKYAKMICKNTTEREILKIQEIYLKKIENKYLKSNKK
jgi:pantothenate kinase type III